ncbi:MAG TPA: Hsp20/alpha crystallin family protein [Dictyoglomaceae bacterium]|nr:Hsp20/alpha crystallin family protein [Dictyoglomaceae bacterium]HPU43356.1 Hsp20/alpha crystallin family protein [Dictyoglomaceae bacterium]
MLRRYWDPFDEIRHLQREMDRLLSDFFGETPALEEGRGAFAPAIDMYETDKNIIVKVELPGFKPEDVDISVTEDSVTIQGETKAEEEVKKENFYRKERRLGRIYRRIDLPKPVEPDKSEASYKNGILTLKLTKAAPEKVEGIKIKVKEEK